MSTITVSGLSKQFGDRTLFRDVSFKLEPRERMTLAGRNGSGKTTLLRILAGEAGLDRGTISHRKGIRVALHDQRPPRDDASLRDYVTGGLGWILEIEAELGALERRMSEGKADGPTLDAYADAQTRLELAGGYRWREAAMATVRGLGFDGDELDRSLASFSGGELTRASLARVLASKPDLLLLDEPTNHLDIESLEWLERHLTELDAAVVLVAHDRWFLESVGTSVLELDAGRARHFSGPWHAWRAEQSAREIAAGRDAAKRQREIARMERFVERFRYKASKARQAQSKLKAIERIKRGAPEPARRDARSLSFSFGAAERTGRVVLELERGRIEVPGRTLISEGEMWLERGEHVTLIGSNGSGKTMLAEALVGNAEPAAGRVRTGHNVKLGYLPQHTRLVGAAGATVLSHAQNATGLSEAKTRALLGRFLFSGDDALKRLDDLSGGESRQLALAIMTSSDANVLVLDEPTNHLDLESREALEDALDAFQGAVLLISHDRALLEAVGSRTLVIEERRLRSHPLGWADFRSQRDAERERGERTARNGRGQRRAARPSKNRRADLERLEREVETAEARLHELEDELGDPSHWGDPRRSAESARRHESARRELDKLYARWQEAAERIDSAT
jgi:ATP-binding cassette, subfamily F, member 3